MKTTKNLRSLPTVLTTTEFAQVTGMNKNTVARWCRDGKLPAVRTGGIWLISRDRAFEGLM